MNSKGVYVLVLGILLISVLALVFIQGNPNNKIETISFELSEMKNSITNINNLFNDSINPIILSHIDTDACIFNSSNLTQTEIETAFNNELNKINNINCVYSIIEISSNNSSVNIDYLLNCELENEKFNAKTESNLIEICKNIETEYSLHGCRYDIIDC